MVDELAGRSRARRPRRSARRVGLSLTRRPAPAPGRPRSAGRSWNVAPRPGSLDHADVPAALLHDAVDDRQAEARAFALLLGREEGLEQLRARLLVMPVPVSLTLSRAYRPGVPLDERRRAAASSSSTSSTRTVTRPPSGIASRALTTRFSTTCSTWPESAMTIDRLGAARRSRTRSPARSAGGASCPCRGRRRRARTAVDRSPGGG